MYGRVDLVQSDLQAISGKLPNEDNFTAKVRVIFPHALVMLKLLALADRYSNIRGPKENVDIDSFSAFPALASCASLPV
jgi:hypothetical protein